MLGSLECVRELRHFHPPRAFAKGCLTVWLPLSPGLQILRDFVLPHGEECIPAAVTNTRGLAKRVIACLDVRANDRGDLVVTKGDQYDVRDNDAAADGSREASELL